MKRITFVTMVFLGMAAVINADESGKDITTFPSEGIAGVNIRTTSGLIHIESAPVSGIIVEQYPDNARACNVTMKVDGKRLILKALAKPGEYKDIKTGFHVRIPAGIPVTAAADSGHIEVYNMTGTVDAKTASGSIKAENLTGGMKANADSGSIRINNVSGSINARTDSGSIMGDINPSEATKRISLRAASGSVLVSFPADAKIAVDAKSDSGNIRNDFSGKAGVPVKIRTDSGAISISKAEN